MIKSFFFWRFARVICAFFSMSFHALPHAEPLAVSLTAYEPSLRPLHEEELVRSIDQLEALYQQDNNNAGALLDLAFLYCQAGDGIRVNMLLLALESKFSPPPKILDLIRELQQQNCARSDDKIRWILAAGYGHDTNINQGSAVSLFSLGSGLNLFLSEDYLPQSSPFQKMSGYISYDLDENSEVYSAVTTNFYTSLSSFNLASLSVGHIYKRSTPNWKVSSDMSMTVKTLGGASYNESFVGSIEMQQSDSFREYLPLNFGLHVAYFRYPGRVNLDNQETMLYLPFNLQISNKVSTRFSAAWLHDKAMGDRPGGDRVGASLGAEVFYQFSTEWAGYAGWLARFLNDGTSYAPPLLDVVRRQRAQLLSVVVQKRLTPQSSLKLELQRTSNADTIPFYGFTKDSVALYWVFEGRK